MKGLQRTCASARYSRLIVLPRPFHFWLRNSHDCFQKKARPHRAFWHHRHAKSATQTSGELRDPITQNSRPTRRTKAACKPCLTALPGRSTLVTWSLANSVGNYSWRRAGVHFRARSIDVVPLVASELESQTHAKGKNG